MGPEARRMVGVVEPGELAEAGGLSETLRMDSR